MELVRRFIHLLRQLMQRLNSAITGSRDAPNGDIDIQRRLHINSPIADPKPCTREQATAFYLTLDGFQQQIEELPSVKNDEQLEVWYGRFNSWTETNWGQIYANMCDGTSFFTAALRAIVTWAVLQKLTKIKGTIRADATIDILLALAEHDLAEMEKKADPDSELQFNRIVRDLPLCTQSQTVAFYATIDALEAQTRALLASDSYESLQAWVMELSEWLEDTWGEFYDNPCGLVLEQIFYAQSRLYTAAGMQLIADASGASNVLTKLIDDWRNQAAVDLKIIESLGSN